MRRTKLAISFGFSASDFVAAGGLIKDIVKSLKSAGGSQEQYRELVRELESLERLLQHTAALPPTACDPIYLQSVKAAACSCWWALKEFKGRIDKYERTLGTWSTRCGMTTAGRKIEWELEMKESVHSFRTVITFWTSNINSLLAMYGLQLIEERSKEAHDEILITQSRVEECRQTVRAQKNLMENAFSTIIAVIRGDIVQPLAALGGLVTTAW